MKIKIIAASLLVLGASLSSMAQGYKDGIEYYKVGQFDNAKELLERNLNNASTDKSEAYYYLGQIALHNGKASEAKAFFDKGLAANAQNPYNLVGLGAIDLKAGNEKAAEENFKAARKLTKKDAKLETAIARAYYNVNPTDFAKDITKSINNARKWKAKDPDSYIFEGDTYADKEAWGDAAGQYELAMTYEPDNVEAYVKYANTYFNVNPDMAIGRLEELLAKQPNSALVQRQLAEMFYKDNQGVKAAEQYGQYIKNPNHFIQDEVRYVQLLFFGNKYKESYDLATSIVNDPSATAENVFYMRRMQLYNLVALEDWVSAADAGKSFFAMAKPQGSVYEVRDYTDYAEALQKSGSPEEAVQAYEKAIELNPKNVELLRNLSDTYAAAKDYEKSAYYYQKVIDSNAYKANDLYELAVCYYNVAVTTGDETVKANAIGNARKYLADVNEQVPGNVRIVNQMARVEKLAEGENTGKAIPAYNELLKLLNDKDDKSDYASMFISAYNYLATYYFNKGDKDAAKGYYKKWLEYDPENEALRNFVDQMK